MTTRENTGAKRHKNDQVNRELGISLGKPLTRRELDVVRAVLAGHVTDVGVAKVLCIEMRTARTHLWHIYAKSGAINLADLVLMAVGRKKGAIDFDIAWE